MQLYEPFMSCELHEHEYLYEMFPSLVLICVQYNDNDWRIVYQRTSSLFLDVILCTSTR